MFNEFSFQKLSRTQYWKIQLLLENFFLGKISIWWEQNGDVLKTRDLLMYVEYNSVYFSEFQNRYVALHCNRNSQNNNLITNILHGIFNLHENMTTSPNFEDHIFIYHYVPNESNIIAGVVVCQVPPIFNLHRLIFLLNSDNLVNSGCNHFCFQLSSVNELLLLKTFRETSWNRKLSWLTRLSSTDLNDKKSQG